MNKIYYFIVLLCVTYMSYAQTDLQTLLNEVKTPDSLLFTQATFKTVKLGVGHTVETRKKGALQITLGTRYWNVPTEGKRNSFLVDRFSANFGVDYAFTDRLTFGSSVTSFDGVLNGYGKYRLLRQKDDDKTPLGITLVQNISSLTRDFSGVILPEKNSDKFMFVSQVILARKINRNFSLQFVPTYIHTNSLQLNYDTNDFLALGFGGRYKIGPHVSIISEYNYLQGREQGLQGYNPFFLGVNWEVGDIVVQFHASNAKSFEEAATILYTPNNFNFEDGGFHFGVNVTHIIHFKK